LLEEVRGPQLGLESRQEPSVKRADIFASVTALAIRPHVHCIIRKKTTEGCLLAGID
jgi:hypothetical protein